jgi:hypothetical protein
MPDWSQKQAGDATPSLISPSRVVNFRSALRALSHERWMRATHYMVFLCGCFRRLMSSSVACRQNPDTGRQADRDGFPGHQHPFVPLAG